MAAAGARYTPHALSTASTAHAQREVTLLDPPEDVMNRKHRPERREKRLWKMKMSICASSSRGGGAGAS